MSTVDNKRKELLEKIKEFRLLDDDFMSKVFEDDYDGIEFLLHIITEIPDLKVQEARTQYSIKNLKGRSVRLDIYAVDSNGKKYNIEVQRADRGAGTKRARYNSSVIDANSYCLVPIFQICRKPMLYLLQKMILWVETSRFIMWNEL